MNFRQAFLCFVEERKYPILFVVCLLYSLLVYSGQRIFHQFQQKKILPAFSTNFFLDFCGDKLFFIFLKLPLYHPHHNLAHYILKVNLNLSLLRCMLFANFSCNFYPIVHSAQWNGLYAQHGQRPQEWGLT